MFRKALLSARPLSQIHHAKLRLPISHQVGKPLSKTPVLSSSIRTLHMTTPKFSAFRKKIIESQSKPTEKMKPIESSVFTIGAGVGVGVIAGAGLVLGELIDVVYGEGGWHKRREKRTIAAKERAEYLAGTSRIVRKLYDIPTDDPHWNDRYKYLSNMSDESLRGSIVNVNDLIKVLRLLHQNREHIASVLEKLGSDYLQNLLRTLSDVKMLNSEAFLYSTGNNRDVLALACPNELVRILSEPEKFSSEFHPLFTKNERFTIFMQSLSNEDLRKVINCQSDFITLLAYLGNTDKSNICKYFDKLGHDHLNHILDKNGLKAVEIISSQGLTDKAAEQLVAMRGSRQFHDILKIFEEQPQPAVTQKCRM